MIKSKNRTMAIISTLLAIGALALFLLLPMFGDDTGLTLALGKVDPDNESRWLIGITIAVYALVALIVADIVYCISTIRSGRFFKTLSTTTVVGLMLIFIVSFSMFVVNDVLYGDLPSLPHFLNPFADLDSAHCHHVCIGWYGLILMLVARVIVQFNANTAESYYRELYAVVGSSEDEVVDVVEVEETPVVEEPAVEVVQVVAIQEPTVETAPKPTTSSVVSPTFAPVERRRGGSNARAVARDRDGVMHYVNDTALFDSSDIQPAKELTLAEKIAVLITESVYHQPMTEAEIMDYILGECDIETKENPLSQSRYVMYKDKAMGFFHTFRDDETWEIVARVEEDFATELTSQLDTCTYSVVPKSPKWIRLPSSTPANIVKAVFDSSIAETGIVADEHHAQEADYRKRLRDAKKIGIADVKSVSESFKGVDDVEVVKADKRNYISIKKDGKTLAFINGKDIDFKITVKADESRLAFYASNGVTLSVATFPTKPGWYVFESEGTVTLDMVKTILNDAYKVN